MHAIPLIFSISKNKPAMRRLNEIYAITWDAYALLLADRPALIVD